MTEEIEQKDEIKSFDDLAQVNESEKDITLPEKSIDEFGRSYATGKRKDTRNDSK